MLNFFLFRILLEKAASRYAFAHVVKKSATSSSNIQTLIARKTAMSFWDSVTTGAQNAAETTKLVSIVRLLFSFSIFSHSLLSLSSFARNQKAKKVKQNSDTPGETGFISLARGPRAFKSSSSNLLLTDKRCVSPVPYYHRIKQRTKLQAEVMYFEQQIKQIMQNFGVECFPHMEQSNSGLVQQAFLTRKEASRNTGRKSKRRTEKSTS